MSRFHRRQVLAGIAALGATPAWAAPTEQVEIAATPRRRAQVSIWSPPRRPKAVAMLSTGHGAWPDRYADLIETLNGAGFVVAAPLHVDSMRHPDRAAYSMAASFVERLADLRALTVFAAERWSGAPRLAVGHSYGTLASLCLAGALPAFGARQPGLRGVLGYSTPGRIPGLVPPDAYARVDAPVLIVTGDRDVVPGFAPDPAAHLFPVTSAPAGDKFGLVLAGADHGIVAGGEADLHRRALAAGRLFASAYGLGVAADRRRLAAQRDAGPERWIVR